jgi:hypothetical protein
MAEEVLKERNANAGIHNYRYKVCSKYGNVEKPFARNHLLHDEHLTATVLGIDINKEGFLKKMSIAKGISRQDKLASIIVCKCKKAVYAGRMGNFVHGGRGISTLCTLCKMEE